MDVLKYGKAICYSGYRKNQNPLNGDVPSKEEIAQDMEILAKDGYTYVRLYDPNVQARRALEIIRERKLPLQCLVGIDSRPEVNNPGCTSCKQTFTDEELRQHAQWNDAQIEKLIELVKDFPEEVVAVSVGNENTPPWGAHMVSEERLIAHAKRLKEALHKPVTFCEGYYEWPAIHKLADVLDLISVHSYPYHYGTDIADAVSMNQKHYADIQAMYPDQQVIFTELGWSSHNSTPNYYATTGNVRREIIPDKDAPRRASLQNEKRYIEEVSAWLEQAQIVGFLFEAFDEWWKSEKPSDSECNFGLYTIDRVKKW